MDHNGCKHFYCRARKQYTKVLTEFAKSLAETPTEEGTSLYNDIVVAGMKADVEFLLSLLDAKESPLTGLAKDMGLAKAVEDLTTVVENVMVKRRAKEMNKVIPQVLFGQKQPNYTC
jgi:hypothetical protein